MIYYSKFMTIEKINTSLIEKNKAVNDKDVKTVSYNDNNFILQRQRIRVRLNNDIQIFDVYDRSTFLQIVVVDVWFSNAEYRIKKNVDLIVQDILSTTCNSSKILFISALSLTFKE